MMWFKKNDSTIRFELTANKRQKFNGSCQNQKKEKRAPFNFDRSIVQHFFVVVLPLIT